MNTEKKRKLIQVLSAIGLNVDFLSLAKGEISQLKTKGVCVPALNCYSCPAAIGACPVGSLQNSLSTLRYNIDAGQRRLGLYVAGSILLMGSLGGRLACGWLCPFGFLQELIYKIPGPKIKIPEKLNFCRYIFLFIFVLLMPVLILDNLGLGTPWFCKLICPAGTLEAGIFLAVLNPGIRNQLGWLFAWKMLLLLGFFILMALSQRPFCRLVCPLGTMLGWFNRFSAFRMKVDLETCIKCQACQRACPVDLKIYENSDDSKCIRCLKCEKVCPVSCIAHEWETVRLKRVNTAVAEK